jgi:lysophospholipase L1-like esterase
MFPRTPLHWRKVVAAGSLVLAAFFTLTASSHAQNLVSNGGFENALKDWGSGNAAIFEVTKGKAAEGEQYMAIQSPDAKEKTLRRVIGGLTAGEEYTLAVRTRKNTIADLRIVIRNTAKKSYVGMIKPLPSEDWKLSKLTFKSPGTEVGLEISARAAGSCELDDVAIVAGKGDGITDTASAKPSTASAPATAPAPGAGTAPAAAVGQEPFADQIAAFEAFDKVNPPKPGAVLFVGSSTLKRWLTIAKYFPEVAVLNRGFGGARMSDVLYYADRIVIPCKARHILVVAGDNDLAGKATAADVLRDFKAFVAKVHAAQPETVVSFISIKPSPHRERIASKTAEANRIVEEYTKTDPKLGYVDITGTLLGADGKPDATLYEADGLHLNEEGYKRYAVPIKVRVSAIK